MMKASYPNWSRVRSEREFEAIVAFGRDCQHLIRVYEIIRCSNNDLHFVCEFMDGGDLRNLLREQKRKKQIVQPSKIRSILHQVLLGLEHIHSRGFMHRDLKPENLLLSSLGTCKISDFSLARLETHAAGDMTNYVASRWYRAPEIVLEATRYTSAVDIFALGCIMAEMLRLHPLFPGKTEQDQLFVMLPLLGHPTGWHWPEGILLLAKMKVNLPQNPEGASDRSFHERLSSLLHVSDPATLSLMGSFLSVNPSNRPAAINAIRHQYFAGETSQADTVKRVNKSNLVDKHGMRTIPRIEHFIDRFHGKEASPKANMDRTPLFQFPDAAPFAVLSPALQPSTFQEHRHVTVENCDISLTSMGHQIDLYPEEKSPSKMETCSFLQTQVSCPAEFVSISPRSLEGRTSVVEGYSSSCLQSVAREEEWFCRKPYKSRKRAMTMTHTAADPKRPCLMFGIE